MFGGLPETLLDLAFGKEFQLVISPVLLDELDGKLREKFEVAPGDAELIRLRLVASAVVITPNLSLRVVGDDLDDDRVLECAVAGGVDAIVSGDRHLLRLSACEGIPILTVRQFLEAIRVPGALGGRVK